LPRDAIRREGWAGTQDQPLDRVGDVLGRDVVVAAVDAQLVRLEQHVRVGAAGRWLEAVRGELDQEPERIPEVVTWWRPWVWMRRIARS
jgi:hypothetical protein